MRMGGQTFPAARGPDALGTAGLSPALQLARQWVSLLHVTPNILAFPPGTWAASRPDDPEEEDLGHARCLSCIHRADFPQQTPPDICPLVFQCRTGHRALAEPPLAICVG